MTDYERYLSCARQVAAGFVPDDRGALLEAVEELKKAHEEINNLIQLGQGCRGMLMMEKEFERVTKERDAAVMDFESSSNGNDDCCHYCKKRSTRSCTNGGSCFEWRGLCAENCFERSGLCDEDGGTKDAAD